MPKLFIIGIAFLALLLVRVDAGAASGTTGTKFVTFGGRLIAMLCSTCANN